MKKQVGKLKLLSWGGVLNLKRGSIWYGKELLIDW